MSETVNGIKYTSSYYDMLDVNSDILAGINPVAQGILAPSTNDTYWSLCYAKIRKCNVVIEKGEEYTGTGSINASLAVARFFRAYQYFWLLQRFGGVPVITKGLTSTSEELYAPRNSRYEVAKQIFDDLDYAIQYLPDELAYDGKISKTRSASVSKHVRCCLRLRGRSMWELLRMVMELLQEQVAISPWDILIYKVC